MSTNTLNDGWAVRPKVSAFAELGGGAGDWTPVQLPHDALISAARTPEAPGGAATGYFPSGAFEYKRSLQVPVDDAGKIIVLEFGGVYRDAMVYVNGALAGQHAFGYSRFTVRIDPYLNVGGDNEVRVTCRAHQDSRWYTGAGIYRAVKLIVKEPIHIAVDGIQIHTREISDSGAIIEVVSTVVNEGRATATVALDTAVTAPSGFAAAGDRTPVTMLPGESATVRHRLTVDEAELWNVESPSLYGCAVRLLHHDRVVDEENVDFGVREISVDSRRGLRINGEVVKLRGASVHSDNGPLGAVSVESAELRRVRLLKAAGFNAIRSSHNPASPALLAACDRVGMFVVDEAFDMWTSSKSDYDYASDFAQWWERDLEALVAKNINHPSVIMHSIGNEIPETGTPTGGVWSRRLAEKLRTLDSSRPVTNGINGFVSSLDVVIAGMQAAQAAQVASGTEAGAGAGAGAGVNGMMTDVGDMMNQIAASDMVTLRTEESFSVLDVAGMNYGDARYMLDKTRFPNRVILGTESFPSQIARIWSLVEQHDHVIGDFTWTGWDYLGEAGLGSVSYAGPDGIGAAAVAQPFPWLTAWCGDFDVTGQRRPASFYREIAFGIRTEPYIAVWRADKEHRAASPTPWAWSDVVGSWSWVGHEGKQLAIEVYADADEVELILNGTSRGRAIVGETMPLRADFDLAFESGELIAVAYVDGREIGRSSIITPGSELQLSAVADRAELDADGESLAFVEIALTDASGRVHLGRDREVVVTVGGAGRLVALGSADPSSIEGFAGPCRTSFDGRVLAVVCAGEAGTVELTIEATGCEPQRVAIPAS